jgi:protein gp37
VLNAGIRFIMSETTNIAWATSTGNPWIGCTKVSPGCKNCYAAELDANRFSKTMGGGTSSKPVSHWGKGAPRVRTKAFWQNALKWQRQAAECERFLEGQDRPRIFPSLCDIWDGEVPIEWLSDYLKLVHDTPNLDHLILTKRPELCLKRLQGCLDHFRGEASMTRFIEGWMMGNRIPDNVWIGVSVEDQQRADERIPLLLRIPAKVRFLSVEPLLESVNLASVHSPVFPQLKGRPAIWDLDWVIVGGESGPNRRDCGVDAICDVAKQCQAASVPCFVKQDSAFKPGQKGRIPDEIWALKEFPNAQPIVLASEK